MSELNNKVAKATKWSVITEIVSKLVTPITSMVLARLLTPEAFGVVTTLTMIISFAELFTDAGFQKYLVQHEFIDVADREQSTTVAFWSNFIMSLALWSIIIVFAEPLAALVGNPGLGIVLIVACVAIPIAAFSSIQMALYRRDLDFKTLFKVRLVSIVVPLVVTVPLAFWLRSYWALVLGSIMKGVISAILLTYYSSWKPRLYYSFKKLKEMLSFSVWSLVEAISLWLTSYVDVFIVGTILNQYYLGLYKTSSTTVSHIIGLITAATTPVLFSSLSRLQSDEGEFRRLFFKFQKLVGLLVIPMGVGIFCFSDLVTALLLGDQWTEASEFIGLWGLTSSITIIFWHYSSEVYRAKGRPKLSVLSQWLHIIALWPTVLIAVHYGFEALYTARSLVRLEGVAVNMIIMYYVIRISPLDMVKNTSPSLLASMVMMGVAYLLISIGSSIIWQICSAFVCMLVYFGIIFSLKKERTLLMSQIRKKR
jgi:PST family polysaccharide transporter